jgi:hypothetical protein
MLNKNVFSHWDISFRQEDISIREKDIICCRDDIYRENRKKMEIYLFPEKIYLLSKFEDISRLGDIFRPK